MQQSPRPLLSIIIPTLNESEHLPHLLADLKKQKDISLEIIVADGGSSDTTRSVADEYGVAFVTARRGRGAQMNTAAGRASGDLLLFLHADSRIDDYFLLTNAVCALTLAQREQRRIAGHFSLRFIRSNTHNRMAYRYIEEKSTFNRVNTTNGDQGLLLSQDFFQEIGGFDESLPFLEDQRIAGKIRSQGELMTLPGGLSTSARRFEAEGFHRRYILMAMMMGLHTVGVEQFFTRAPGVYRLQHDTGRLSMSPFFTLLRRMMFDEWGLGGTLRIFYLLGRYIRQNSWQMLFFIDVWLRPILGAGRYPCLNFHDRIISPFTNLKILDAILGALCFVWFMGVLAPFFWLLEYKVHTPQQSAGNSTV